MTFPTKVVVFINGLSNHQSSSTNRVAGNGKYRKLLHVLDKLSRCCIEIAPINPEGTVQRFKRHGNKYGQLSWFTASLF